MSFKTKDGQRVTGLSHQAIVNAPDASGRKPLDPTKPGKLHVEATPVLGHRNRKLDTLHGGEPGENMARASQSDDHACHQLGMKIMDEAYQYSGRDDQNTRARFVPMRGKC
jgi:hypothetical protein